MVVCSGDPKGGIMSLRRVLLANPAHVPASPPEVGGRGREREKNEPVWGREAERVGRRGERMGECRKGNLE